ncbi:MAG: response regulator transcription factor [Dehalococcoidales bacterium]|nr:response regulator transcription factor [Dehalococcoidales bacterium]
MKNIRVMLVDDHTLVREGINALMQVHNDIDIVGEASNGREAIEKANELDPDVIVMDLSMPAMGGIEATRKILRQKSAARIVVLSRHEDVNYVRSLLEAGASGYVSKKAVSDDLATAIRTVYNGEVYLHPSVTKTVTEDYVQLLRFEQNEDPYERLTEREKEILHLLAEGYSSRQIADQLYLASKTVINHRKNIMVKLGINSPIRLLRYAIEKGLVDDSL